MAKRILNPFGDSSDESEDGFNNPFAKTKPKPKAKSPPPAPAPAPVPAPAPAPAPALAAKGKKPSLSNPFADDEVPKPLVTKKKQKPKAKTPPPNPFADDGNDKVFKTPVKAASTNPFGGASTNPFGDSAPVTKTTVINPSAADTKPKNDGFNFGSSSNPFNDKNDKDVFTNTQTPTRKNKHIRHKTTGGIVDPFESKGVVTAQPTVQSATKKTANPFDFDANFTGQDNAKEARTSVKKSLFGRRKVDKDANKADELKPIVLSMDKDDNKGSLSKSAHGQKGSKISVVAFDSSVKSKPSRPGFLGSANRSKSEGTAAQSASGGGWFNKVTDDSYSRNNANRTPKRNKARGGVGVTPASSKKAIARANAKKKAKKKNMLVQCWPYDDYHKDQEKYYESIQEIDGKKGAESGSPRSRRKSVDEYGYYSGSDDDTKEDRVGQPKSFGNETVFDRPSNLSSIKEAVQNLSLFDFENKAEQRAISIVSTWLFDAGLIDELLVNGANGYRVPSSSNSVAGQTITSVKSSEGVEVGAHGFPIEGGLKIDKEAEKLRASTQRELTLINARLNEGVAASGSEVQELVNAVSATKNELGRLRELSTYISSGYKKNLLPSDDPNDRLLLADYPRLKRAINARRNIFRCFRELEFFSQIPLTCDRLREELHKGEWTDNEFTTIRDVSMEHVELEILLIEAESGMKAWLDDEDDGDDDSSMPSLRSNKSLKRSWKGRQQAAVLAGNHQVVDNFLSQHVKNVWELGEEIRMRILSGVGSALDLALKNPAGMVALVEAVEVYERAAEQFKASRGNDDDSVSSSGKNTLRFTDMRASALACLYQDFELSGIEVFRKIHGDAADLADEDDDLKSQFNAVLVAATELVTQIDIVKNQMAPCFAPHWHVEMLWSSCVAHVCSNQIIQQIGGPEGNALPDLSVTQLLDLIAWVEFFRETIEDAFPSIESMHAKKTYFDERPDLFAGNEKAVNMENAKDSLAWVNNMLWEVHRLAQDEFLLRTRAESDKWITKVYSTNHETTQTKEGRLVSSLCSDIFSLLKIQLKTIRERLTRKSDALVMAVCLIFSQLRGKQLSSRDKFLTDLETCCIAANDFERMSEEIEDVVQELIDHSDLPEGSINMLEESCGALVSLFSGDAVFAAQRAHSFIFEPIWEAISEDLFGPKWIELTNNELAKTLTRTLDDFMGDLETFLNEFMLKKTVDALVASTVVFYIKCLLLKAEMHKNNKLPYFSDTRVALERMDRDIKVMRDYFVGLAEGMPALGKVIEKEFSVLTTILELIRIAAGLSESEAADFILPLHKRVKDINITKHVVGDLWHLVQPTEERAVWELTESLEESLIAVCPPDKSKIAQDRMTVPGLRLDETLAKLCIESERKRPVHASVVENMISTMKSNWAAAEVDPKA